MDKTYLWRKLDQFQRADLMREVERQRLIREARRSQNEVNVSVETDEKQECPAKDTTEKLEDTPRHGAIGAHRLHSPLEKKRVPC
jgi:hypothetical protein